VSAEGQAVIGVSDNGIGIDPELLPNVFELFEQGKRTLDRSQGGLGVGLTLVRRLVELHAGTVEATSDGPGKGSQFRIRLPCVSEAVGPDDAAANEPGGGGRSAAGFLVVDDNHDAAEAAAVFLAMAGHEVKAVGDGAEALASAPVFAPDVVVLDIGLPVMDGYEVRSACARCRDRTFAADRADRLRPARRSRPGARGRLRPPPDQAGRPRRAACDHRAWRAAHAAAPADEPAPRTGNLRDATSRR
jgi:hypothetical protein